MKAILVLLLLIVIGGIVLWYGGGYSSFDPSQQGRDARAAIAVGMDWADVVNGAGEPKEYRIFLKREKVVLTGEDGAFDMLLLEPGAANRFNPTTITNRIAEGSLPHGFQFEYRFSHSVAFAVIFDETGTVTAIEDLFTTSDLLQMKD